MAEILSVSVPAEMARDIRERHYSPSELVRIGYSHKINNIEKSVNQRIEELQQENEKIRAKLEKYALKIWELEEDKNCSTTKK